MKEPMMRSFKLYPTTLLKKNSITSIENYTNEQLKVAYES